MRRGLRGNANVSVSTLSSFCCEDVSATLRASASRALVSACCTSSLRSPRCGTLTSTLRPLLVVSALANSARSSNACDTSTSRAGGECAVSLGEIGAVAPVLPGAEEEHLDAGVAAGLVHGEHVGFLERARIDALMRCDRRQRGNSVAICGGTLEIERRRGLVHFSGQLLLHRHAAAGEKRIGLAHQFGITGEVDLTGAWRRAAFDLIEQTRPR